MSESVGKIAIIGAGNQGTAMAMGILESEITKEKIILTRKEGRFTESEREKFWCMTSNQDAISESEILVVAVQPRQADEVFSAMKGSLNKGHLLISVVSGIGIEKIETLTGKGTSVVRAMPNTGVRVRQSMTCLAFNESAEKRRSQVVAIFNSLGKTLLIGEEKFPEATVACGSGIALALRFLRADMQGNIQFGFDSKDALLLSIQVLKGAAMLLEVTGNHPESAIDQVTTPDGCTIAALVEMDHGGFGSALLKGKEAGRKKARGLYAAK